MAYMTKSPIPEQLLRQIQAARPARDEAVQEAARITDEANAVMKPLVLKAVAGDAALRVISQASGVPVGTIQQWRKVSS